MTFLIKVTETERKGSSWALNYYGVEVKPRDFLRDLDGDGDLDPVTWDISTDSTDATTDGLVSPMADVTRTVNRETIPCGDFAVPFHVTVTLQEPIE